MTWQSGVSKFNSELKLKAGERKSKEERERIDGERDGKRPGGWGVV